MPFILALLIQTPLALADVAPRCGGQSRDRLIVEEPDPNCDSADTAQECDPDSGLEHVRYREKSGLPAPVVGSLLAGALVLGVSARRRLRG